MSAYYNEFDPKAAAWLRELIAAGHIAPGDVDTRSIADVSPTDLNGYTQCHFFAGVAGWSLALRLAGWPDNKPVWTGSCPCQPFSDAGKGAGTADARHLWPAFFALIAACQPAVIFGEQVASAAVVGSSAKPSKRNAGKPPEQVWLDGVFADLESAHYACGAADIPAAGVGAPHRRQRLFWMAYGDGQRLSRRSESHFGSLESREPASRRIDALRCSDSGRLALTNNAERGSDMAGRDERDGPTAGRQQGNGESGEHRALGVGLADTKRTGLEGLAGNGDHGHESGRHGADATGSTAASGGAGDSRLGDAEGRGCGEQWHEAFEGRGGHAELAGGAGFVGMADAGHESAGRTAGCEQAQDGRSLGESSGRGPWSDFDIIPCRDGKARRIESGSFPLAHGIPGRVGLLRGYGNAIVPQVAAEFIKAAVEAIG